MISATRNLKAGFTLVEILIVIAILGVIMGAVYSVYLVHQKSAYTQEEVVEVQQNLRIAMDQITRDVRMAGMLVPLTNTPLAAASAANTISINTASARGVYAMIDAAPTPAIGAGDTSVTLTVETKEAVDVFKANEGNTLRILRPLDCSQPVDAEFTFAVPTDTDRASKRLTLQRTGSFSGSETLKRGDMIVMTPTAPPASDSVIYSLINGGTTVNGVACPQNQQCLVRTVNCTGTLSTCYTNTTSNIAASNLSGLEFGYILDDGTETATPASADLANIRAVRVTITGQTATTTLLSGGPKTRQLSSVIKIRNRRH